MNHNGDGLEQRSEKERVIRNDYWQTKIEMSGKLLEISIKYCMLRMHTMHTYVSNAFLIFAFLITHTRT